MIANLETETQFLIRCDNCGREFDVLTCQMHKRAMPNTLTNLEDIGNPGAECPHCGFVSGEVL